MLGKRQSDVFRQRQRAEQRPVLKKHAEAPPEFAELGRRQRKNISVAHKNFAGEGRSQPQHNA